MYSEVPIEEHINKSSLIIKGKLVDKYYQKRDGSYTTVKNGNVFKGKKQKIFTIFVFSVEEIQKGSYKHNEIEVMMLGGCENDNCMYLSTSYSFDLGEEAVLLLKEREGYPSTYKATGGATSLYQIDSKGFLLKKSLSDMEFNNEKHSTDMEKNGKYSKREQLTWASLKLLIKKELEE